MRKIIAMVLACTIVFSAPVRECCAVEAVQKRQEHIPVEIYRDYHYLQYKYEDNYYTESTYAAEHWVREEITYVTSAN